MSKLKIVCFTGHRPSKFIFKYNENHPDCIQLKKVMKNEIIKLIKKGYFYFVSGMALGVDQWAVEILLELKKTLYPNITIECMIPCKNHSQEWPQEAQKKYLDLIKDELVHYSGLTQYKAKLMITRDYCMVNKSDVVIAVYDGSKGGTQHTFEYAKKMNRHIIRINPLDDMKVEYTIGGNSTKILECSSLGDANYSALYAKVDVFGKEDTIENWYQLSKRFMGIVPNTIKDAKGKIPTSFVVNNNEYDIKYLSQWYSLLWCKYLDQHTELVKYAKVYDKFNDTYRGKCINCQADIIELYVKEGRKTIINNCTEFINLLKMNM